MTGRVRTTCTRCRFGCVLEIVRDGRRVVATEYPGDSIPNAGRLCPRGSASARLLDHPQRLCYPLHNGRDATWREFADEVVPVIRDCPSNELAITYDRNLTREELELVFGLANALGTELVGSSRLENEAHSAWQLDVRRKAESSAARPEDAARADAVLLVGDVFGVMPVMARPVLDARYADRGLRLVTVDCVQTRAAGFASRSFVVRPGLEPLILFGLAAQLDAKLTGFEPERVAKSCGVSSDALVEAGAALKAAKRPVVMATIGSGRVPDPKLLAGAVQVLFSRLKGARRLFAADEGAVPPGLMSPGEIFDAVRAGRVKALVNFGEGFPFEYPSVQSALGNLQVLVTTATLRNRVSAAGWVLPVPLDLEKDGTAGTLWGDARLTCTADPASGTRSVAEIVEMLTGAKPEREAVPETTDRLTLPVRALNESGRALLAAGQPEVNPDYRFMLIAEKPAYGFLGLFPTSPGRVLMHPDDVAGNGLTEGKGVNLESARHGKTRFTVQTSARVRPGTLLVDFSEPQARDLFDVEFDPGNGMPKVPPMMVRLWPSE